jgi:hypothetical protein
VLGEFSVVASVNISVAVSLRDWDECVPEADLTLERKFAFASWLY